MASKYKVQSSDIYIKNSDVPKNKLNIEDSTQIHELEKELLTEINALHPFYELNGRITRLFFDMIVLFNGYKYIDYSAVTAKEYIEAAIECVQFADSESMGTIILNGLNK